MRILTVGPVPPFRGGISQHTARLADALAEKGHTVDVLSWRDQYPRLLFPGTQPSTLELATAPHAHTLRWWAPWTWVAGSRRSNNYDLIVISWVHPFHALPLTTIARFARRAITVGVIHNSAPHEHTLGSSFLLKYFLRQLDGAVVLSTEVGRQVDALVDQLPIRVSQHPPNIDLRPTPLPTSEALRLLFLGYLRHYKGLERLIDAMPLLQNGSRPVSLTIAGEAWGNVANTLDAQVRSRSLANLVTIHDRYFADDELQQLFATHHLVVLPYLRATQSGVIPLAQAAGRFVVITPVGGLPTQVRHGIDGVIADDTSSPSLVKAIRSAERLMVRSAISGDLGAPTWGDHAASIISLFQEAHPE